MLKPGDEAPDFAVGADTLHGLLAQGPVVVFFFPKAFTPGCTKEAGEFRERFEELRKGGGTVIGVSTDPQPKVDRFRRELNLPFPMVGDPEGAIVRAYEVRWPVVGWARRVTFVIGADRRVIVAYHSELHFDEHAARACTAVATSETA